MLYEMEMTYQPYDDKNDGELEAWIGADEYPDMDDRCRERRSPSAGQCSA